MDRSAKFWDRISKRYSKQPVADEESYQKKLQVTREYFRPDMEVLEFGCGTGSTAIVHAPFVKHIQAIDVSPKMIAIAQGKADAEHIKNVIFDCLTLGELNVPDSSVDVVMGHSILHLLENWEETITSVYKMLKPGGVFVSSTTCIGDSMKFFKFIAPVGKFLGLMPLIKIFTTKELENGISAAGFEIVHQWQPGKNKAVFIVAKKPD